MSNPDDYSNHYALLIGTGTDFNGIYSEKFKATANDAEWLATILKACAFPPENVKVLTGFDATKANIIAELFKIKESIELSDDKASTVVVFFSGHCRIMDDKAILMPYGQSDPYDFTTNGIDGKFLLDQINLLYADKVLIVLNTCHADAVMPRLNSNPIRISMPLSERQLKLLGRNGGVTVLSATQASDRAQTACRLKGTSKKYSPFTIAFGRALTGAGKTKPKDTGLIFTSEIIARSAAIVREFTKGKQQPAFDYQGGNFPVGRYWQPVENKMPFNDDEDEIAVDIEERKEQEENIATPATSSSGRTSATNYNQAILGNCNNYGNGTYHA